MAFFNIAQDGIDLFEWGMRNLCLYIPVNMRLMAAVCFFDSIKTGQAVGNNFTVGRAVNDAYPNAQFQTTESH